METATRGDSRPRSASPISRLGQSLDRLGSKAWFHYLTIFLLQLKVVWGMWDHLDLTFGDTASYFETATAWFDGYKINIAWSPLYTAFYGSLRFLSQNAYTVTILHRLIIVFAVTLLILAVMRRLLPAYLAWLVTVWWAVLPVTYNALYEVHLFALLPVLVAWLLALENRNAWYRGIAVAVLAGAAILVRNELIVATLLFGTFCVLWEWRRRRLLADAERPPLRHYLFAYGLPLAIAIAVVLGAYARSFVQYPVLAQLISGKHDLNMCQVYAYGYQQRHPEWTKSPWLDCEELMQADFGERKALPLTEMLRRNPRAVVESMIWNFGLTRAGLQVLLFGISSGGASPDYMQVAVFPTPARLLSGLLTAIWALGLLILYRDRHYWWNTWGKKRVVGLAAMLAVILISLLIIPTQRPRPSYLFAVGIAIMAGTGVLLMVLARRAAWPPAAGVRPWLPALLPIAVAVAPSFYLLPLESHKPRTLLQLYERLAPFAETLREKDTIVLAKGYFLEIPSYFRAERKVGGPKEALSYAVFKDAPKDGALEDFLAQLHVNFFYVDQAFGSILEAHPRYREFFAAPHRAGWKPIAYQATGDDVWAIYVRERTPIPETTRFDPFAMR